MPTIRIRIARVDDLEATVDVWERSRWHALRWLEERMQHSHADNLRHFGDVVMRESQVWLAIRDGQVAGLLALRDGAVGHVEQLFVDPDAQGQGLGTALLDHAKARSPQGLTLFTHQKNARACRFYEARGFRAVAFGVSPPPESEPDVKYAWVGV